MILGTVELGLDYGVNNRDGKPSRQQAFELLETAWEGGIRELDTAAAYGDSEEIIGSFQKKTGHSFLVDTKLPISADADILESGFNLSCGKLNTDHINLLYLHSFEQSKNSSTVDFLEKMKGTGRVSYIGISIYEPSEMDYIISNLPGIDIIQFPYNILDNYRWDSYNLLERAVMAGKKLYVRSVFLQGLIFKNVSDEFAERIGASQFIVAINNLAAEAGMTVAEMAYKFVFDKPEIESVILGCQKKEKLLMNLSLEKSDKILKEEIRRSLEELSKKASHEMIDPRKWKR